MEIKENKLPVGYVIFAQLSAIAIWFLITVMQWMNNPKGSPGILIPIVVRSVEAVNIFLVSGLFIFIYEKLSSKKRKTVVIYFLVLIIYFGAVLTNILSLGLRSIIGFAPPHIDGYFYAQSLHFYIPLLLVLILYGITRKVAEVQIERENKLRAESMAQQAKWLMLRYQVNPHFLFNALNTIRALIGINNNYARKIVTEMSEYFRYSLSSEDKFTVTIEEEMNAVKSYLEIQKIRFQDKISYSLKISESARLKQIPVFSIQTLVENAIKYGMKTSEGELNIEIQSEYLNGVLDIIVRNTGNIVKSLNGESTNKGLNNLTNRLNHLFPYNDFCLFQENGKVIAHISINI